MRRALLFAYLVTLLSIVSPNAFGQLEKPDIAIGIGPDFSSAYPLVAMQKGMFVRHGFKNVELKTFSAGVLQLEALVAGGLDVALPAEFPVVSLRAAGRPLLVLANTVILTNAMGLAVREDKNVKEPTDLYGLKIGLLKGSGAEMMFNDIVKAYKLDATKFQVVNLAPPEQLASMASGAIDGIVVWEPWIYEVNKKIPVTRVHSGTTSFFAHNRDQPVRVAHTRTMVTLLEPYVRKNPNTVRALIAVWKEAQEYISNPEHYDEVSRIVAEYHKQSVDMNLAVNKLSVASLEVGPEFVDDLNQTTEFLLAAGRIKQRVDPLDYIYDAPLKALAPRLVTIAGRWKP